MLNSFKLNLYLIELYLKNGFYNTFSKPSTNMIKRIIKRMIWNFRIFFIF
jgi:hypothetical protein